jgi:hypothetical protein
MPDLRDILIGVAPALAWSGLWIQFVTVRFFDKPEIIFKDWVTSGAKDLAISNIESAKLIPALAQLCDTVAYSRATIPAEELRQLSTADILTEVDFLPHLARAEAALREKTRIEQLLCALQEGSSSLWKLSLVHCLSVILLPAPWLIARLALRYWIVGVLGVFALSSLAILVVGIIRYQRMRDEFLKSLENNRKVADA